MKFGVFILGDKPNHLSDQEVFANVLEEARWAEELGYDEVWLAEHHFSPYGMLADLPLVAAAIAAVNGDGCRALTFAIMDHLQGRK